MFLKISCPFRINCFLTLSAAHTYNYLVCKHNYLSCISLYLVEKQLSSKVQKYVNSQKNNKAQVMHVFKLYVRIMGLIICQLINTCGIFWPHIILIFEYPTVIYIYLNAELPSCIERFLGWLTIYEEVRSNIWRLLYSCAYFLPSVFLVSLKCVIKFECNSQRYHINQFWNVRISSANNSLSGE